MTPEQQGKLRSIQERLRAVTVQRQMDFWEDVDIDLQGISERALKLARECGGRLDDPEETRHRLYVQKQMLLLANLVAETRQQANARLASVIAPQPVDPRPNPIGRMFGAQATRQEGRAALTTADERGPAAGAGGPPAAQAKEAAEEHLAPEKAGRLTGAHGGYPGLYNRRDPLDEPVDPGPNAGVGGIGPYAGLLDPPEPGGGGAEQLRSIPPGIFTRRPTAQRHEE